LSAISLYLQHILEENKFNISTCPVCGSPEFEFSHYLNVPDWLVSKENFELKKCGNCSFIFTANAPLLENAGPYYESEEYVEHTDTNKGLIYGVYHQARKLMLKFKLSNIRSYSKSTKLLDIGSGSGYFINYMKQNGYNVSGVEISDKAVALCKDKFDISVNSPTEFLAEKLPKDFDIITMWHVFEHVYSFNEYFDILHKSLKENGHVFVALPNPNCFEAKHYKNYWNGFDTPRHLWHFTPKTFKQFAEGHGFEMISMKRLPLDPFFNAMVSSSYKSGLKFLPYTFTIGLISFINGLINRDKASSLIYILKKSRVN
jgi:2-polyprenyl-3-methyl-5-hydroxy-6-metoxy-1,4-benzoquinol methylase